MRTQHSRGKKSRYLKHIEISPSVGKPINLNDDNSEFDLDDLDNLNDLDEPGETGSIVDDEDDEYDAFFDGKPGSSAIERLQAKFKGFSEPSGSRSGTAGTTVRYAKKKKTPSQLAGRQRSPRSMGRKRGVQRWFPPAPDLAADSAPEPKDKEIKSLWRCGNLKELAELQTKWNRKFRRKCLRAIKRRNLTPEMRAMIGLLLSNRATTVPIMTNPNVGRTASRKLHKELVAIVNANPEIEMALVTIISGDGATSHTKPVIELHHSQKQMQSTLNAMAPNHFGVTELALFNSHPHPNGGQVIQVHGHALIWGVDILSKAQKVAGTHVGKFAPNITDAPPIDVRRVRTDSVNIARVCAYLFKPPHRAMTWCPPRDGKKGHMHQSEKGDRFIRYLRMAEIRSLLTFEDICFAAREGQAIVSDLAKRILRTACKEDAGGARRPIHPDAIASFWAEVAKALGKNDWEVPVVARHE